MSLTSLLVVARASRVDFAIGNSLFLTFKIKKLWMIGFPIVKFHIQS